ncbi:MAG TPA: acyl-CoA dehydrogenase family protein, partial [Microthrixaceae bacterium]|nr:acyl-CoA dehydrogenase family protein [Microthrixaceae bacterium]
GFVGHHWLEVLPQAAGGAVLRHTLRMHTRGLARFTWPVAIRPLHDALLEDALARAEAATSLSRYAALAVVDGRTDGAFHAQAAWTVASEAAVTNAQVNIQNHGGIGFTWEHTAHRFLTRAQFLVRTLGDRRHHLSALLAEPAPT